MALPMALLSPLLGAAGSFLLNKIFGDNTPTVRTQDYTALGQQQWKNYFDLLNRVLQGEMPAGYEVLAESIRKQTQAAGQNLLNRAMSRMAAQGILRSGLSNQVARDISAMTASDIANALAQLRGSLFRSALSLLPSAISSERSYELARRRLSADEATASQQAMSSFWQALGQWGSSALMLWPYLKNLK